MSRSSDISGRAAQAVDAAVDLFWLPLGAGGRSVRWNGRVFEAVCAAREGRQAQAIYHAALEVRCGSGRFVVEMAPAWSGPDGDRGVLAVGPVGVCWAGRWVLFRYEIRCWRGGSIPDVAEAVDSPVRLSSDARTARRVLAVLPGVPAPTWGRDELRAGEMWNSNSVVAWTLERGGLDAVGLRPPTGGRAPGWDAGVVVAQRELRPSCSGPTG